MGYKEKIKEKWIFLQDSHLDDVMVTMFEFDLSFP